VIIKNIFPGLSRSWNFQEKIHDFQGGMGTLQNHSTKMITIRDSQIHTRANFRSFSEKITSNSRLYFS